MMEITKLLQDDTKRTLYLENNLFLFWLRYFPQFFTSPWAKFHKVRAKDFLSDKNLFIKWFRESAKTIWTMIFLMNVIAYKKYNYVLFYSYEDSLAGSRLFDLIVQLKTNHRYIRDFGYLFPDASNKTYEPQKKSQWHFITSNKIKFEAMSINSTSRGKLFITNDWAYRPDLAIFDDVDVIGSVRNPDIVAKNIDFVEGEVFGWLASDAKVIFLWNVITNIWLVPYFEDRFKDDKNRIVHRQAVIENGEITRDRFVRTDEEMEQYKLQGIKKISLETKRRDQGDNYEPNFLLIPNVRFGNPVFDHELIMKLVEPPYATDERYKELKLYRTLWEWEKIYDVSFGMDSAMWWAKWDPSTIIGRDSNYNLVLSFQWQYDPESLAEVMDYIFTLWYIGRIVPEMNSMWTSLINSLTKTQCKEFIYREKTLDKVTNKPTKRYWIIMTAKLKQHIMNTMNAVIKDGTVSQMDKREIDECMTYYYDDKMRMNAIKGSHDDLVIADALSIHWLQQDTTIMFT